MTPGDPISTTPSIVDRAKAIILKPKEEWHIIAGESATVQSLFTGYAMILAAIPALATLIGSQVFGYGVLGFSYKPPIVSAISMAVAQYILNLLSIFVLGIIINYLAPNFGGTRDKVSAAKVAVYSATASWLAGIFSLIPALTVLGLLGLYSLYLLYTGLPVLMKTPEEKATPYAIVTIIVAIVLSLVAGAVAATVTGFGARGLMGPAITDSTPTGGTMNIPGIGKVDLDKMQEASNKMEAAAAKMEEAAKTGKSDATDPATLQALLPASIGAYRRTEVSSTGMGAGGSQAEGRYEAGDKSFRVEITDMAAIGALAGLGAAFNVQSNRQTDTEYEKTSTVDGRIITERWNSENSEGEFGTTIANRFKVEAEGQAASIDELKGAVASVGLAKLEALSKG